MPSHPIALACCAVAVLAVSACDTAEPAEPVSAAFSFQSGADGWTTGFADYSDDMEESIGFVSGHRSSPTDFAASDGALYLRGANVSDDLKLYAKRQLTGLVPRATYQIDGTVVIGSQAGAGCIGIGGAPGESVVVKIGASATEPRTIRQPSAAGPDYILSIDVGGQNLDSRGPDGLSIGDLAVPEGDCDEGTFLPKTLRLLPERLTARADDAGRLWLLVGTDSGFEGINEVYLDDVDLTLAPE